MKRYTGLLLTLLSLCLSIDAQNTAGGKAAEATKGPAVTVATTPAEVAKATVAAHGGDKLRQVKSLVVKGAVTLMVNGQELPAAFSTAYSGDKYFFEIISPIQQLKQVYDGTSTYSSLQGFALPPVTSLGFPVLSKIGDAGFVVAALGDKAKKKRGFRVTTPEGFYTDFYVDEKTGQVKGYDSSFETGGRVIQTSVDIDGYQTVDGVLVPIKYSQRFDMGPVSAYANFKAKQVLVNSAIEDSAFALPK